MESKGETNNIPGSSKALALSTSDSSSQVCPKKNKGSPAWTHFTKVTVTHDHKQKTIKTKCNYCGVELLYDSGWGTSSMLKHLRSCSRYPQNIDKKQKFLTSFKKIGEDITDSDSGCLMSWKFDQDHCRRMLARMVIIDEQPFSVVEREGFRDFVSAMQPMFKHVSRFTIAKDCMKLYVHEKSQLMERFKSLKSRIAFTTDIWTSIQNLNYLCLTAHFVDDSWALHKRIINFVVMPSHKGKDIGKVVEKCIHEWGLENRISTITVDNASSNDTALKYLKERYKRDGLLILNGEFFHMRCAAHILNLIVKDGLTEIQDSIDRIRSAIRYVRSSPSRAQQFQACIERERITYKGSVCLDISTRWNSTYLMLETALKFRKAFERLEDEDPSYAIEIGNDAPLCVDWEYASVFSRFLRKFYEITKRISGSLYVTSNSYFYEVVSILTSLNEWENDSDPSLQSMTRKMKEKFFKYYGSVEKTNLMVLVAVVLDPRFKLKFVKYCYREIYGNDDEKVEVMLNNMKNVIVRLFEFYDQAPEYFMEQSSQASHEMEIGDQIIGDDDILVLEDPPKKIKDGFEKFMEAEENDIYKSELDQYLEQPREKNNEDFDILAWWRANSSRFRVLSRMARDVLPIPVSTVASESAFSTSGRVLDQFRSSLTPRVIECLVCAQDWLRNSPKPISVEEYLENAERYEMETSSIDEETLDID